MNDRTTNLINDLRNCLTGADLNKAYLFGSRSEGLSCDDSDVDLVLVLNRSGPFVSAKEHRETVLHWRRQLRTIAKGYGLDLIVFTLADWKRFIENNSSFAREIQEKSMEVA